ncbi:MAG: tRNA pseudouridine(38-40) synthase TruA [Magnetococcales bacterium]|nr:tRNA pseudouridine(38-40) synthase TruA [Magnetococcales bacterium]
MQSPADSALSERDRLLPTTRFRLDIEYVGEAFSGWQRQAFGITLQGVLEEALARLCGHAVTLVAAGRTDAGVHALGQVAHFDTSCPRPEKVLLRAINATTPPDLTVLRVTQVSNAFHARHAARHREYLYRLSDRETPSALDRGRVWHHPATLDEKAMRRAARILLGTHDFSAFRAARCQAKTPVRTLSRMEIHRSNDEIRVILGADGFLHHMVRNIVGSLVLVGQGKRSIAWFENVLASRDRTLAGATAPPHGLYLNRVLY